jgi:hypothetical protein
MLIKLQNMRREKQEQDDWVGEETIYWVLKGPMGKEEERAFLFST